MGPGSTGGLRIQLFPETSGDHRGVLFPQEGLLPSYLHQHTGEQGLAWGEGCYFCSDFLFPCPQAEGRGSGEAAAADAVVKISALFVARIPAPPPPGGALGNM